MFASLQAPAVCLPPSTDRVHVDLSRKLSTLPFLEITWVLHDEWNDCVGGGCGRSTHLDTDSCSRSTWSCWFWCGWAYRWGHSRGDAGCSGGGWKLFRYMPEHRHGRRCARHWLCHCSGYWWCGCSRRRCSRWPLLDPS